MTSRDSADSSGSGPPSDARDSARLAALRADQQRVATLAGEGIDQGGDVLVGAEGLLDGEDIVRVLPAIGVEKIVKILGIAERREGHGFTS